MFDSVRYFILMIYLCGCCSIQFNGLSNSDKADFFLDVSKYMSKPYMWTRSQLARLYSPFWIGHFDQFDSTFKEIVYRNFLFENLLPIAPISFVIGELATLPRSLSYKLRGTPYDHIRGGLEGKQRDADGISLLSMNICFMPGELPLFFGGVAPAADRVSRLGLFIKEIDPDVVCLYEAHEIDSIYELYAILKEHYAHFYVDIGPNLLDMNSGLFVASKYEIDHPQFKSYQYLGMQSQINKGYFEFQLVDKKGIIAQIYSTHLQPYQENSAAHIRKGELDEVTREIIEKNSKDAPYPIILCGDFNIPWGSKDYLMSGLKDHFFDDYNKDRVYPSREGFTSSDYITALRWNKNAKDRNDYYDIIDYALLFNKNKGIDIRTKRIEAFDEAHLDQALSDHHALFSVIKQEG